MGNEYNLHAEHQAGPSPAKEAKASLRIAGLLFLQMLPATLLTPAIRPLFASQHAHNEHAMHAFMAVNMLGAAFFVPLLAARAERLAHPRKLITVLLLLDAVLLCSLPGPLATPLVIGLRFLEGGVHVGATSLLMAEAAAHGRASGTGRTMGLAGAALMFAVALGSGLGGQLVAYDVRAPFWAGAAIQGLLALTTLLLPAEAVATHPRRRGLIALAREHHALWAPLGAAFVGRFTVGCLVVTFALFAHKQHAATDRTIGWLFSLITLPFALSMYPISRLSDRVSRASVMTLGAIGYATSLLLLGYAPYGWLPVLLFTAGVFSACLFAPCLCYAASLGGPRKESAMALLNTAGCLGMLLGPTAAGLMSSILGASHAIAGYRAVFAFASASVMIWLGLSGRWLLARRRMETLSPLGQLID